MHNEDSDVERDKHMLMYLLGNGTLFTHANLERY
jgi:hypothetical protein